MGRLARFIHFYTDEDDGADVGPTNIVSGNPPLSLVNAIAKKIRRLIQYGKCTVSGTDITCNNGVLKYGALGNQLFDENSTTKMRYLDENGAEVVQSQWSISDYIEVDYGTYYTISGYIVPGMAPKSCWYAGDKTFISSFQLQANSTTVTPPENAKYLRCSIQPQYYSTTMINKGSTALPYEAFKGKGFYTEGTPEEIKVVGVNQWDEEWEVGSIAAGSDYPSTVTLRSKNHFPVAPGQTYYFVGPNNKSKYLFFYDLNKAYVSNISLNSPGSFTVPSGCYYMRFAYAYYIEDYSIYNNDISINYPSTDHDYHPHHIETATASNLFAVGSVTDEQDIISGTITRRCEAVVSDGTTPSGRYIGTVGEGNILVCAKETGYSGAIASFTADKAEPLSGLVAEINPVQDLHGYDAPWPAGGGKNKLPMVLSDIKSANTNGTWSENSYTYRGITYTVNLDSAGNVFSISASGTASGIAIFNLGTMPSAITEDMEITGCPSGGGTDKYRLAYGSVAVDFGNGRSIPSGSTAERSYIRVNADYAITGTLVFYPMIRAATASATYEPYANICPISGWTGVQGQRTGFNVWDEEWEVGGVNPSTGGNWNTDTRIRSKNYIPIKPNTTYFNSYPSYGVGIDYCFYDINKTFISSGSAASVTITSPQNAYFMRFATYGQYGTTYNHDISINYPSSDTDYHAYTGEAISVSFGQTVYGGSDEVVSGQGLSTYGVVDLGSLNWQYRGSVGTGIFSTEGVSDYKFTDDVSVLCSIYKYIGTIGGVAIMNDYDKAVAFYYAAGLSSRVLYVRDTSYTDVASFKSAMSGQKLVYELATPQSFTHEGQSVDTVVGQNNVFVDTGNVTAYVPDFTTEKVAGQSLSTTDGTNTVFVTSNVDPVELEVEYRTQ